MPAHANGGAHEPVLAKVSSTSTISGITILQGPRIRTVELCSMPMLSASFGHFCLVFV